MSITVHGVLAGAYRGKMAVTLTHASTDGGATALCPKVKPDSLCDLVEEGPPTCTVCATRLKRLTAE